VAESYKFPRGYIIKTIIGGSTSLKSILLDLKKYAFNGYLRTTLSQVGKISVGYIVVKDGVPILSIHRMGEKENLGRTALSRIWRESYSPQCSIEIHARVNPDEIIEHFADLAIIETRKVTPPLRPIKRIVPTPLKPEVEVPPTPPEPEEEVPTPPEPEEEVPATPEPEEEEVPPPPIPEEEEIPPPPEPEEEEIPLPPEPEEEEIPLPPEPEEEEIPPPPEPEEEEAPPPPEPEEEEIPLPPEPEEEEVPPPPELEEKVPPLPKLKEEIITEEERVEKILMGGPEEEVAVEKEEELDEMGRLKMKLEGWKEKGYKVNSLDKVLDEDPDSAKEAFEKFEENIKRMDVLKNILISMGTKGYEEKVENIKVKLTNPEYILAVEAEIETLRENIEKRREVDKEIIIPKKKELPSGPVDEETNIILQYTFDNFVVGQSNRFPWGASLSVAKTATTKEAASLYNPLFIWSGPGLGKTHLLNAIGNYIKKRSPDAKMLYTSGEKFASELAEAIGNNELDKFGKIYRTLDVLLIDDVQFLASNEKAQEELFHTFNALYSTNKQIAFTSDRLPRDIPTLQDRLLSRFESGLVADIQPAEFDTRLGILIRKTEESNLKVGEEILELIANVVSDNIRELEGAFNKVIAYSRLMNRELNIELAREALKDLIKEEVKVEPKKISKALTPGGSYLVEEEKAEKCFEIFIKAISDGYEPLMITRFNPKRMRNKYDIEKCKILWLTDKESETEETVQPVLERIISIIEEFLKDKKGIVLTDGLEYLISMNSFDAVIRFLRSIIDEISETESAFLLSVSPKTMKEWELKTLEKEMEILDVKQGG